MMEIILFLVFLFFYFLPPLVANERKHKATLAIFVMTFFLGWTGLLWIAALIWACNSNVRES